MTTRRNLLRLGVTIALAALAGGCGSGLPDISFDDAREITRQTLHEALLGAPESATRRIPPEPPLLRAGVYETVLLSADAEGFARVSNGAINPRAVREAERRLARDLDRDLKKRGFSARAVVFGQAPKGEGKTLLAVLTPTTQQGGSPRERADGKNKTFVLVRLSITDAATGSVLRQLDYYSGRDVKTP